ncbi:hypothetical protein Shyhy01_58370 [Streptomyces hygroscopicus subsp. hygroscopicus]|nr:hypothetical protein Shyhy01_58370 [Streptomyces hygroscopicus subsp. hygroscopicus]
MRAPRSISRITARSFRLLLSPTTSRGARLARLLATEHLRGWGILTDAATHVIAELAAHAATHGRVPGGNFRLALGRDPATSPARHRWPAGRRGRGRQSASELRNATWAPLARRTKLPREGDLPTPSVAWCSFTTAAQKRSTSWPSGTL